MAKRSKQDLETAYEELQSTTRSWRRRRRAAVHDRRGKKINCKVTVTPLVGGSKDVRGAILMMEENGAA